MCGRGIRGGVIAYNCSNLPVLVSSDGAVVAGTAAQLSSAPASIVGAGRAHGRRIAGSTLASGAPPGMPFASLRYQAFLFEDGIGTRPRADALAGVDLGGMTLGDPIAISADGSTLVGHATCAGTAATFRASRPR